MSNKPPEITSPIEKGSYCADIKWRRVITGYDSKTIIELATKLESTAKLDANKLDSSGIKFSTSLEKIINSNSNQEFEVSAELYDNLISYCTQITIISKLIKDGVFGNDSTILRQVRSELLKISISFGTIKKEEQKKKVEPAYIQPSKTKCEIQIALNWQENSQVFLDGKSIPLSNTLTRQKAFIVEKGTSGTLKIINGMESYQIDNFKAVKDTILTPRF